jgi:eukaryotic-like serine/threonine-protein kinase
VLAEAQEQAAGKEAALKVLDAAAVNLRSKLGESLGSLQKYDMPVANVTTISLEASESLQFGKPDRACERRHWRDDRWCGGLVT